MVVGEIHHCNVLKNIEKRVGVVRGSIKIQVFAIAIGRGHLQKVTTLSIQIKEF